MSEKLSTHNIFLTIFYSLKHRTFNPWNPLCNPLKTWSDPFKTWSDPFKTWSDSFKKWSNLFKTWLNFFKTWSDLFKIWSNFFKTWLDLFTFLSVCTCIYLLEGSRASPENHYVALTNEHPIINRIGPCIIRSHNVNKSWENILNMTFKPYSRLLN